MGPTFELEAVDVDESRLENIPTTTSATTLSQPSQPKRWSEARTQSKADEEKLKRLKKDQSEKLGSLLPVGHGGPHFIDILNIFPSRQDMRDACETLRTQGFRAFIFRVVQSQLFDALWVAVIIVNAIVMGVELQLAAQGSMSHDSDAVNSVEAFF